MTAPGRTSLMTAEAAGRVLERVIDERVIEHVDFAGLLALEVELWRALHESGGAPEPTARAVAKAMIDRALAKLPEYAERYLVGECGVSCVCCELDAQAAARRAKAAPSG